MNTKREPKHERDYCETFVSQRNIMTCHDMSQTCHMRHIIMPDDQIIIKKQFCSCNNLLNATFQSHPIKMGCCSTNEKSLIVTTINPFGLAVLYALVQKQLQFVALKARKTSSLHTILF